MKITLNVENAQRIFEFPVVMSNGNVCKKIIEENFINHYEILNIQMKVIDSYLKESITYEMGEDLWNFDECFFKSLKKTYDIRSKEMEPDFIECEIVIVKNKFSKIIRFNELYEEWNKKMQSNDVQFSLQQICSQIFRNNWMSQQIVDNLDDVIPIIEEPISEESTLHQQSISHQQSTPYNPNENQESIDSLVEIFDTFISNSYNSRNNIFNDYHSLYGLNPTFQRTVSPSDLQLNTHRIDTLSEERSSFDSLLSFNSLLSFVNDELGNAYFEDIPIVCDENDFSNLKTVSYDNCSKQNLLNEECAVCMDKYKSGDKCVVLECNHCFHPKCIKEWLCNYNHRCPTCRVEVGIGKPQIS